MESRVEVVTGPNGERIELGTVTHEGREFTSGGAVVDLSGGYIVAYIACRGSWPAGWPDGVWPVTTWAGAVLGSARVVSSWRVRWSPVGGDRMYAIRARIEGDDRTWIGRCWGPGLWVKLRPAKARRRR